MPRSMQEIVGTFERVQQRTVEHVPVSQVLNGRNRIHQAVVYNDLVRRERQREFAAAASFQLGLRDCGLSFSSVESPLWRMRPWSWCLLLCRSRFAPALNSVALNLRIPQQRSAVEYSDVEVGGRRERLDTAYVTRKTL